MDTAFPNESIKDMILRMTKAAWEDKEGVLLARLGDEVHRLSPELVRAELKGRALAQYIREELHEDIELYKSEKDKVVRLALPRSAAVPPEEAAKYFPTATPTRKAAAASGVTGAVRLAFSRELPAGKKRVLYLTPKPRFTDIDADAVVPTEAASVPSDLIMPGDMNDEEHLRKVLANIAAWRTRLGLDIDAVSKTKTEGHGSMNLLDLLLGQLTDVEKKRVQLPLDIVAKLRSAIVR